MVKTIGTAAVWIIGGLASATVMVGLAWLIVKMMLVIFTS